MGKVRKPPPTPMMEATKPTMSPQMMTGYTEIERPPATTSWSKAMRGRSGSALQAAREVGGRLDARTSPRSRRARRQSATA